MLRRLAYLVVKRRRLVLVGTAVFFVAAGGIGGGVAEHLSSGGFNDPAAPSSVANKILEDTFGAGQPNLLMVVTAKGGRKVDAPQIAAAGNELTAALAAEQGIDGAASYWSLGSPPPLRSTDGSQALVLATIGGDEDAVREVVEKISPEYSKSSDLLDVKVGGFSEVFRQVGTQIESDLAKAESVALPLTLILLVLVFGSVVAASLPLAVGAISVVGTFLVLRVLSEMTTVSIFALNLTTAMGLGLAIDYALFVVSRYREELRNGRTTEEAVVRSVETAGRTVVFSAFTVAVSLAALLVFPLAFLRSFAYAGIAVVAVAALGAVVFLPALLAALGPRIDKWSMWRRQPKEVGTGMWHSIAMAVMRRPVIIGASVIIVLLLLGAPFLGIKFALPDDRVLPPTASSRQAHDALRLNFASNEAQGLSVVAPGVDATARKDDITRYAIQLSKAKNVARVDTVTGFFAGGAQVLPPIPLSARFASEGGTWFSVVPTTEAMSADGERVVKDVRAIAAPFPVKVGGLSAMLVDAKKSLFGRMPLAAGLIALVTLTVLFLMTGSVLVPIKAIVLNLLSLTATFGAMVWIFQEGHLSRWLDFTATGAIDTTTPILMFCVAFGLSMDYEVFLLSRIKEEHDLTGDNVRSVAIGLEHTGRIVTAAAGLLAVVFLAFATSQVSFIKLFGLGLAMAVVMDATIIRGLLVPSFMRLAGEANWWAPPFLRRVYGRVGFSHADSPESAPPFVASEVTAADGGATAPKPRRERPLRAAGR
ncbi:MAG TPA: MMPL family transporter [Acidimicrobiales bacterium]|nr:MMPL family transporter [Acidimicrobiales bacterium]